jgi:hypothetical protein
MVIKAINTAIKKTRASVRIDEMPNTRLTRSMGLSSVNASVIVRAPSQSFGLSA